MKQIIAFILFCYSFTLVSQDTSHAVLPFKNEELKTYWEMVSAMPRKKGPDKKDEAFLEMIKRHPDEDTKDQLITYYNASQKHKKISKWIFLIGPALSFVPVIATAPIVTGLKEGPDNFGIPTAYGFQYAMLGVSAGAVIRITSFAVAIVNRNKRRHEELEMERTWNNYLKTIK